MRIVATSSLAQKHPQLFTMLSEQHEITFCVSAKTLQETLNAQPFWNIALAYPEDISESNTNLYGTLFCVVPKIDPHTLSLLKRSDVEDLLLESELDWFLPEKIKKWERLHEKALAQFPLHDLIHDIKTPLAVIHITLEILLLKKCQENADVLLQKVQSCKSHLDRITNMLANFVNMSRISDFPLSVRNENVNVLITQVLESQASRIHVECKKIELDPVSVYFRLDRNVFKQMIHNMVDHFLLFSEDKASGNFLICQTQNELHVDLRFPSQASIPKNDQEKVFSKTGRVVDHKLGVKYNRGFGLTYNRQMALSLGGNFLIDFSLDSPFDRDGIQVLRLQLPTDLQLPADSSLESKISAEPYRSS